MSRSHSEPKKNQQDKKSETDSENWLEQEMAALRDDRDDVDSDLDEDEDEFTFVESRVKRKKHASEIEFIKQIQFDNNDHIIHPIVQEIVQAYREKEIGRSDLLEVLKVLIQRDRVNVLMDTLHLLTPDFLKHDDLFLLLTYALQENRKESSKQLLDVILRTYQDKPYLAAQILNHQIHVFMMKHHEYELLDRLFNDCNELSRYSIKAELISDIKAYDIFQAHHIHIDPDPFNADQINDEVLEKILKSEAGETLKSQMYGFFISSLLLKDRVKSITVLLDDPKMKAKIISDISSQPELIRSIAMYDLLHGVLNHQNNEFFYTSYLPALCNKLLDLSFEKFDEVHQKPLMLLESKLLQEENRNQFLSHLKKDMPSLNYLVLSAVKQKLPALVDLFFTQGFDLLDEKTISQALITCLVGNDKQTFEKLLLVLPKDHPSLLAFSAHYITLGLQSDYLALLIKHRGKELFANKEIAQAIFNTQSPQLAQIFIKEGLIEFPANKLEELMHIAALQGDQETLKFLQETHRIGKEKIHADRITITTNPIEEKTLIDFYGTGIPQSQYEMYSQQMAGLICHAIKNNTFSLSLTPPPHDTHPQELNLYQLGKMRQHIAELCGTTQYASFGKVRERGMVTPHNDDRYRPYFAEFLKNLPAYEGQTYFRLEDYKITAGEAGIKASIIGVINDVAIPLTTYDLDQYGLNNRTASFWEHTHPHYIKTILSHAEMLIKEISKTPINTANQNEIDDITQRIATIHWWLSQATAFDRGSAAVTEWIIMGLFKYHGLAVDWQKRLPDCWALTSPTPDIFAKRYGEFSKIGIIPREKIGDEVHEKSSLYHTGMFKQPEKQDHPVTKPDDENKSKTTLNK